MMMTLLSIVDYNNDYYRDHPGAALPGERHEAVLVPGWLGDLKHHLVALELARDAGLVRPRPRPVPGVRVHQPRTRAVARVDVAAVLARALHPEPREILLLLTKIVRLEKCTPILLL